MPYPYGGKQRQVMIDIDLPRLYGAGPVAERRQQRPAAAEPGAAVGDHQGRRTGAARAPQQQPRRHPARLPRCPSAPLTARPSPSATCRRCATAIAPQTSVVRANGRRGVLMTLLKSAGSSTLDIVKRVREVMPGLLATLPPEYKMDLLFDQSRLRARADRRRGARRPLIAAGLTALMILLFLGSWRSTRHRRHLDPPVDPDLAVVLACLGQTINLMTLGGLSLAVGILVDDATVELENVAPQHGDGKPLMTAILDGAQQIATPAFVATLCICIVFIPIAFISGAARSLFTPLGDGGRLRHDDVVLPVANPGAHDGAPSARRRDAPVHRAPVSGQPRRLLAHARAVQPRLRAAAPRIRRATSTGRSTTGGSSPSASASSSPRRSPRSSAAGPRLLPLGGRRAVPLPRARAARNAHRDHRGAVRRAWRTRSAQRHPEQRARDDDRQHRRAPERHQPDPAATPSMIPRPTARCSSSSARVTVPPPTTCSELRRRFPVRLAGAPSSSSSRPTSRRRCSTSACTRPHRRAGGGADGNNAARPRARAQPARAASRG